MDRSHRQAGFTLLESLVAGAVAVILLVALLRAFGSIWDMNARVREDAEAMLVARAVLEAASTRQGLAAKSQEGVVGTYGWGVTISEAPVAAPPEELPTFAKKPSDDEDDDDDEDETQKQKFQLYKVQVVVRAPSGRRTFLDTVKLGPVLQ